MDTGCIFDNHRGIYMGEAIIELAEEYGFILQVPEDKTADGEFHWEAVDDAINFLNENVAEDGYMFEYGIGAPDFMYMPISWWSED